MKLHTLTLLLIFISGIVAEAAPQPPGYAGSASCRECHEKFHTLWATSFHRNSIQPYTDDFAKKELLPQKEAITIGAFRFLADISPGAGRITETGPQGVKTYRIEYALGGKEQYAFLTTLDDGRIESLPLAYDVARKEWYESENSIDAPAPGGAVKPTVYWKNYPFFYSEACPSCHVSRFSISFDRKKKRYAESWSEPGINCETCHGPAAEHNRAMRDVPKGQPVADPKLISVKRMSASRRSDMCAVCHAKQTALTDTFTPGDRYFDHFDLTTLDNPEYFPDGRDQGENYTFTGWLMNRCVKEGKPDCIHCHTSSGRYRFKADEKANDACLPCHGDQVANVASHSHHKADGPGSRCISCHMPKTTYARMHWSDHSMRPPTPAATLEFGSPNACNICHKEKDAAWADRTVRAWYLGDYQEAALKPARLVAAARKRDWTRLPEMLAYIQGKGRDEVFSASLIRLLSWCKDERVAPVLLRVMDDPSPLVRAAAAESLGPRPSAESAKALLAAASDDYRLVRIKAAASLGYFPRNLLPAEATKGLQRAQEEYRTSLLMEPDRWTTWLTVGSTHLRRDEFREAVSAFTSALEINPRAVPVKLNLSYAQFRLGETENAARTLAEAIEAEPDNMAAARMAATSKYGPAALEQAEAYFANILKTDPTYAPAAYGLCAVIPQDRLAEALVWCRKAVENDPKEAKYVAALKRRQKQTTQAGEAAGTIEKLIRKRPDPANFNMLRGGDDVRQIR
jgi:tetratricopeptide (TPR) repeat protein